MADVKVRRTKVARKPYWVPTDNDGKGGWRFLPVDTAHTATVDVPGEGAPLPLYMSKGYLPPAMVQDKQALALLPKYEALHAAQAAGDKDAVRKIAAEIRGAA